MSSSSSSLSVRKPRAILLDIVGTVTKSNWIDQIIFPYMRDNVDSYLASYWGNRVLMRDIDLLRAESLQDGGPAIPRPSETQECIRPVVVAYVQRCLAEVLNHEAIRVFSLHMIFDGYNHRKLETILYSDAAACINKWPNEGIEVHVISNGWSYAMKKFLSKTNHSDLLPKFKSIMDTEFGSLENTETFKAVVSKLGMPAEDILFLTHSGMEGVAAYQAGLSVILVATHREDVTRERTDATIQCGLPFIRIFTDLTFGNDAPVASSLVNTGAMSQAVAASRAGGFSSHASGSNVSMSRASSKGRSSSVSGSKSSSAASSSKASSSSAASGSKPSNTSSGSSKGGSSSSSSKSGSKSSSASGSGSSSAASGSSSATSGSSKSSSAASSSKSSSAASGSKPSSASSGSSKGGSSSSSSKSGSKSSSASGSGSSSAASGSSSATSGSSKSSSAASSSSKSSKSGSKH